MRSRSVGRSHTHTLVRNGRVTRINICSGGNKEFEIGRARLDEGSPEGGSRESRWRYDRGGPILFFVGFMISISHFFTVTFVPIYRNFSQ